MNSLEVAGGLMQGLSFGSPVWGAVGQGLSAAGRQKEAAKAQTQAQTLQQSTAPTAAIRKAKDSEGAGLLDGGL